MAAIIIESKARDGEIGCPRVEFDRHCQFKGHDHDWFTRHQNRQSVKEESYCALQQFSRFIAKLKELGIFDKTLIVLKSDHGKPGYDQVIT